MIHVFAPSPLPCVDSATLLDIAKRVCVEAVHPKEIPELQDIVTTLTTAPSMNTFLNRLRGRRTLRRLLWPPKAIEQFAEEHRSQLGNLLSYLFQWCLSKQI